MYIFNSFAPKTLANVLGQLRALAARQPYTLVMKAMAESLDEVVSDAWDDRSAWLRPQHRQDIGPDINVFDAGTLR